MLIEQAGEESPGMVLKYLETAQGHFTPQFYKVSGEECQTAGKHIRETGGMLGYKPKAQSTPVTLLHLPNPHPALKLNAGELNFPLGEILSSICVMTTRGQETRRRIKIFG
ncbi:uncharacterized [Tachysurus ichikawai]